MQVTIFGATGRTGKPMVEQALAAGHHVTAYVRNAAKLTTQHADLHVVQGDMTDFAQIAQAVRGADAVLSTLGPAKGSPSDLLTVSARNIIAAMKAANVRRLITVTGAGVSVEGDPESFGRTVMMTLLKLMAGKVLEDSNSSVNLIRESGLDYTIVRVPRLTDGAQIGGYRSGILQMGGNSTISRADVADFMLKQVSDATYKGQLPMLSY